MFDMSQFRLVSYQESCLIELCVGKHRFLRLFQIFDVRSDVINIL